MGWFWDSAKNDPIKKLDPGLRQYLEQESPDKYVPAGVKPAPKPSAPESSPLLDHASQPPTPSASLYPDGRYAHLWTTYKPPVDVDESDGVRGASKVIEKYKERGDTVQRAAMENCALEHEALTYCFQTGNWRKQIEARLTMCSAENGTFTRCFQTQSKFLQALGYASSFAYDADREEQIQMHADKLYHQMLDYEKRVEECKAAGVEPPPLTSLFQPDQHTGDEALPAGFKPSKPLAKLTPHERELEIRAHQAQLDQQKIYMQEASPFMKSQQEARNKRREKASSWFGETIGKWVS